MKKIDHENLNKIISDQASEEQIRNFDKVLMDSPMETTTEGFTDELIRKYQTAPFKRSYPIKLTTIALALIVALSLVIIVLYDHFSIPSMSDPMLQELMVPVAESTGLVKQIILIVDSILMLVLIDKFALGPYFNKRTYS